MSLVVSVGAEIADQVELGGACDSGHLRLECLGDLHGVAADTAGCPDDEDPLTGSRSAHVLDALERGDARDR